MFLTVIEMDRHYGPYQVLYMAGADRLSRRFKAVNEKTQEEVAVTVLRNKHIDDVDARDEFYREARRMECEVVEQDGTTYFVIEWSPDLCDFD